jgi:type I restriction enzyme R subunit
LKVYEINENLLVELVKDDTSDTVKIFNLLKSIQEMIAKHAAQAPYLLEIGKRAEAIVQAYQLQLKATQEALEALEDMVREINLAERERTQMNLMPESFAIYWLLNRDAVPNAEWIAREMENCIKRYPHWRTSAAQERDVRIALYGVLLKENQQAKKEGRKTKETGEITTYVEKVMRIAERAGEEA